MMMMVVVVFTRHLLSLQLWSRVSASWGRTRFDISDVVQHGQFGDIQRSKRRFVRVGGTLGWCRWEH